MTDNSDNKPTAGDRMSEVSAMGKLADAVKDLDQDAVARVIRWAAESYGVTLGAAPKSKSAGTGTAVENGNGNGGSVAQFAEIGDLFTTASPTTEADKALVVGYWFQFVQGQGDFGAYEVNLALRDMGHKVANITTAFDTLRERKPAAVVQLKKSGTSKQARKTYKLTLHGKSAVEAMIGPQH